MTSTADPALLLETLRLGVVPDRGASAYTVGRDELLTLVERDLETCADGGGATRCWLGGYGAGKTHLLELIEQRARAAGFLVASAVLDPKETAPSHPRRVYASLMQSLQYPDADEGARGLGPLIRRAATSDAAIERFGVDAAGVTKFEPAKGQHLYLTPAMRWTRELLDDGGEAANAAVRAVLLPWLSGQPSALTGEVNDALQSVCGNQGRLYSLKDYRPWSRIYGYLLGGIGVLARTLGYSGIVVLLDEAEFYSLLSAEDREYAQTLFQALSYAAVGGETDLPFLREELDLGGMGVLKRLPPRFSDESGLYVSFAMTPHAGGMEALEQAVPPSSMVEIPRLEVPDYDELTQRVIEVVERARPDATLPSGLVSPLSRVVRGLLQTGVIENPRQAIKFLVQFLDIALERPQDLRIVLETLRAQLPAQAGSR